VARRLLGGDLLPGDIKSAATRIRVDDEPED
jgi:hypothetical protein